MVIAVDFGGTLVENGVYPYASKQIIKYYKMYYTSQ